MDEILSAFIAECHENLEKLDNIMIELEHNPETPQLQEHLGNIFRAVHTIKGSCGWLGLTQLESVVHDGEELLVELRAQQLTISTEIVNGLLEMFDAVRAILSNIVATGQEGDTDYSDLIQRLKKLQQRPETGPLAELGPSLSKECLEKEQSAPTQPVILHTASESLNNSSIRVDVKLLDSLMDLVGELVLARNQMLQFSQSQQDPSFVTTCQRLNLITTELQEGVMKTRMQTIGTIWNKFPRVVRDLALECGKQIALEMEGEGTELDRTIVEAIKDPLTHLVRNAIDHGLELPEERAQAGKPRQGILRLQAYHEGGHVNITVSDDGRGLIPERLREKAIQKGLISSSEAVQMPTRALLNLIFLPGFSTADKVTHLSGRGVGMDVVKNNIEKIGGLIDLSSQPGEGTTFKIKIPLTLAIIPALMITSSHERFAIPQVSLLELVALEGPQAQAGIEWIYNTPVYRLRGNLLPLVYLNQELGLQPTNPLESHRSAVNSEAMVNIVVLQADEHQFGLVVDEINDTEEIVVKPLSKQLKSLSFYTGATILGDGKVALILDVMGFAQKSQVISEIQKRRLNTGLTQTQEKTTAKQILLLFRCAHSDKMALPLQMVDRLEEFEAQQVEYSGDLRVIQYRQQILPLIYLSEVLPRLRRQTDLISSQTDLLHVVVYSENARSVGLVVDQILDIIEDDSGQQIQYSARREGILGSLVLQGVITEMLDVQAILRTQLPAFFSPEISHPDSLLTGVS